MAKIEGTASPDLKAIVARSCGIAQRMNGGVGILMTKNKVEVISGEAKLTEPGEIVVGNTSEAIQYHRRRCRGMSRPRAAIPPNISSSPPAPPALPGIKPDGKLISTYFEAVKPDLLPKSLIVMGTSAIVIEFASFYRSMGVDVTVVEVMPVERAEITTIARKQLEKRGLTIFTSAKIPRSKRPQKASRGMTRRPTTRCSRSPRRPYDLRRCCPGQYRKPRPCGARRLRARIVGAEVTELIQRFVVAMNLEVREEKLMHTILPRPTSSV